METKQIEKAYVFRLYPAERQETLISKAIGCARFVYNYFLARRKCGHELTSKVGFQEWTYDVAHQPLSTVKYNQREQ